VIPGGTYDLILISGDTDRGEDRFGAALVQDNEQWLIQGAVDSGYSNDLPDTVADISGQVTTGLEVTFGPGGVTSVTAEHWSVANHSVDEPNSVVPEVACFTEQGSG
jgi:hypothetical protein